jgi:hypothetical protein
MSSSEKKEDFVHSETMGDIEKPGAVQRDYSGAVVSLDPREKKLVRKLDIRIMVCLLMTSPDLIGEFC